MLENIACILGSCLGIVQNYRLGIHHLDGRFSPQILFKQQFCYDVNNIRAVVQGKIKAGNIVSYIWVILFCLNQGLSGLMGIIYWFKLQKEVWFQLIPVLNM